MVSSSLSIPIYKEPKSIPIWSSKLTTPTTHVNIRFSYMFHSKHTAWCMHILEAKDYKVLVQLARCPRIQVHNKSPSCCYDTWTLMFSSSPEKSSNILHTSLPMPSVTNISRHYCCLIMKRGRLLTNHVLAHWKLRNWPIARCKIKLHIPWSLVFNLK